MAKPLDYQLPLSKHLPGVNARPDDGYLERIAAAAPAVTDAAQADENAVWKFGLHLLHHEYFWEAHEVLEPVWFNAHPNSRERYLVQGLIQLANAALKARMQQPRAALRLAQHSAELIQEAARGDGTCSDNRLMGVALGSMQETLDAFARAVASAQPWAISLDVKF